MKTFYVPESATINVQETNSANNRFYSTKSSMPLVFDYSELIDTLDNEYVFFRNAKKYFVKTTEARLV